MNFKSMEVLQSKKDKFKNEFDALFNDWKSKWNTPLTGPLHIRKSVLEILPPESIEAQRPETEARNAIIEYASLAIKNAATPEERVDIVDSIKLSLDFNIDGGMKTIGYELMTDIFKNTVSKE